MIAARSMERWFFDFALNPEVEMGELPDLTRQRLERQFGYAVSASQLRSVIEVIMQLDETDRQATLVMYICGYPIEMIAKLATVRLPGVLKQFDTLLPPPDKRRRSAVLANRAIEKSLVLGVDDIEAEEDPDDTPQQIPGVHLSVDTTGDVLKQMGRRPLLSAQEEVEYAIAMEVGALAAEKLIDAADTLSAVEKRELEYLKRQGERSFTIMVESNLRLVASIARKYRTTSMTYLDVMQEGNIGLVRAVHKFDYKKGFKFSTYGTWWIKQSIQRAIADKDRAMRLPVHVHQFVNQVWKTETTIESQTGIVPTSEELADHLNTTVEKIEQAKLLIRDATSLNIKIGDGDAEFGDLFVDTHFERPDEAAERTLHLDAQRALIDKLFSKLSDREAVILRLRWGLDTIDGRIMTLDEIGERLSVTRERVRQIELKAMTRIRARPDLAALMSDIFS